MWFTTAACKMISVYRAAFEETEQQAAQRQEDNVCDMADEGDLQAALALLRRFRPQHYRERASWTFPAVSIWSPHSPRHAAAWS